MKRVDRNLVDCVGCSAADTIQQLVLFFRDLARLTLASYSYLPMVQERIDLLEPENMIVREALELRSALQLPFWDCVMLTISKSEVSVNTLLDAAETHVSLRGSEIILEREAIQRGAIQQLTENKHSQSREICITSEIVMADGSIRHLPMMDFHCSPNRAGQLAATAVCKRIFPGGAVLLKSGESFHAYGLELVCTVDFFEFLGRALLYSPIIDRAYIAHQLIEKRCALRISGARKPTPITLQVI